MWKSHQKQKTHYKTWKEKQNQSNVSPDTTDGAETTTETETDETSEVVDGNNTAEGENENNRTTRQKHDEQPPTFVDDIVYQRVQGFLDPEKEFPDKERFAKFRKDKEVFMLSGIVFMKKIIGDTKWKEVCHAKRISEFCHSSDEAFLALLIENNQDWWNHLAEEQ